MQPCKEQQFNVQDYNAKAHSIFFNWYTFNKMLYSSSQCNYGFAIMNFIIIDSSIGVINMLKDILKALESEARLTTKQLATMTGQTVSEVSQSIKQAEADHIILKYKTVINWEQLDGEQVWVTHRGQGCTAT